MLNEDLWVASLTAASPSVSAPHFRPPRPERLAALFAQGTSPLGPPKILVTRCAAPDRAHRTPPGRRRCILRPRSAAAATQPFQQTTASLQQRQTESQASAHTHPRVALPSVSVVPTALQWPHSCCTAYPDSCCSATTGSAVTAADRAPQPHLVSATCYTRRIGPTVLPERA